MKRRHLTKREGVPDSTPTHRPSTKNTPGPGHQSFFAREMAKSSGVMSHISALPTSATQFLASNSHGERDCDGAQACLQLN